MFTKKKRAKNPILIVRKPEEINKEYSDKIIKIGLLEQELKNIAKAEELQQERKAAIKDEKYEIFERIDELSSKKVIRR